MKAIRSLTCGYTSIANSSLLFLSLIDYYFIYQVKAVIWNISPNVRKDALLSGQARLINMFKVGTKINLDFDISEGGIKVD